MSFTRCHAPAVRCTLARQIGTRIREHKDACVKYHVEKSTIAEHAWTNHHPISWAETRILQRVNRAMEMVLKESLSIRTTLKDTHFNRDSARRLDRHVQEIERWGQLEQLPRTPTLCRLRKWTTRLVQSQSTALCYCVVW